MRETRLDGRLFGFFLFFISFLLKSAEMPHFRTAFLLGIFFVNAIWKGRLKSISSHDQKKPPRSGGPKPEPSDSRSGLERSRDKMSER